MLYNNKNNLLPSQIFLHSSSPLCEINPLFSQPPSISEHSSQNPTLMLSKLQNPGPEVCGQPDESEHAPEDPAFPT